jgi:ring-1,2-phenylacetyl-CoA epoxidase subunit PaaD
MQNGKTKHIWQLLETVADPEIPVISVVELGVIRKIELKQEQYFIRITPTYSGCPAMKTIQDDITKCLINNNINNFKFITQYSPPWTTKWMSKKTKEKLLKYGISPPSDITICPQCKSENTILVSEFGATACKAFYKCSDCLEPFESFKCI